MNEQRRQNNNTIKCRNQSAKRVFSFPLKLSSDDDWVTAGDRLFHTRATATGNTRSPIVERFVRGMTSAVVDDRRCCPETTSDARQSCDDIVYRWSRSTLKSERQHRQTVFDSLRCTYATSEDRAKAKRHVIRTSGERNQIYSGCVQ